MSKRNEIVIIDTSVENYQTLIDGLPAGIEILLLDSPTDALAQIATLLAGRSGIDALHLISHGSSGQLTLGNTTLNADTLAAHADALAAIGNSLSDDADLLLYGCNVGAGEAGQTFIQQLARITRADVAASDDLTGAAALGGDWVLESRVGTVEAAKSIAAGLAGYAGVLSAPPTVDLNGAEDGVNQTAFNEGNRIFFTSGTDTARTDFNNLAVVVPPELSSMTISIPVSEIKSGDVLGDGLDPELNRFNFSLFDAVDAENYFAIGSDNTYNIKWVLATSEGVRSLTFSSVYAHNYEPVALPADIYEALLDSIYFSNPSTDTAARSFTVTVVDAEANASAPVVLQIDAKALAYSTKTFYEDANNPGKVTGTSTITLTGDTFTGDDNDDWSSLVTNVPAGLAAVLTRTSDTTAQLSFTGTADAHANANDVAGVTVTFTNDKFTGGSAAAIKAATVSNVAIDYEQRLVDLNGPADGVNRSALNTNKIYFTAGTFDPNGFLPDADTTNNLLNSAPNIKSLTITLPVSQVVSGDGLSQGQGGGSLMLSDATANGNFVLSSFSFPTQDFDYVVSTADDGVRTINIYSRVGGQQQAIPVAKYEELLDSLYFQSASPDSAQRTFTVTYTDSNDITSAPAQLRINEPVADTTPPVFQSAAISADGTQIILTYDEALSETTAAKEQFAVKVNNSATTISSVTVNGSTVVLNLQTPITGGQTVTAAYTDPDTGANDTNAVQDVTGNDAASLSEITVTNTLPTFTTPTNISIEENNFIVGPIEAANLTGTVTYGIAGGADAARFSINASTGLLSFTQRPDYEFPIDSGLNNIYEVQISANGGNGSITKAFNVEVTDVSGGTTSITSNGGGDTGTVAMPENATLVTKVTATATDSQGRTYAAAVLAGSGENADLTTGYKVDANWTMVAVPPNAPPFPALGTVPYSAYVPASVPGSYYGGSSGPNNTQGGAVVGEDQYYWIAPTSTSASIKEGSYNWIVKQEFTVARAGYYNFNFPAAGDNALEFYINGTVDTTNPVLPTITGGTQIGTQVSGFGNLTQFTGVAYLNAGTNTAYMKLLDFGGDTAAIISQSSFEFAGFLQQFEIIGGADADKFQINPTTGELSFLQAPDRENPQDSDGNNSYVVVVKTTHESVFDTQTLTINVGNVVENTVVTPILDQTGTEDEAFTYTVPATAFAVDQSRQPVTYTATLENGDPLPSWLSFNAATRTFSGTPLEADSGDINIKVTATDSQSPPVAVSDVFKLSVAAVNDAPTDISLSESSVNQSAGTDATVGTLSSTDVETGQTHTYSLVEGDGTNDADNASFNISGSTLRANDASQLPAGTYKVFVRTTDSGSPAESFDKAFEITVVDDVAPSAPSAPSLAADSDTGTSSTDKLTNDTTPTFTGTAEPGSTVKLYDGETEVGSATADEDGKWSITSSTLAEGAHTLTVKATDPADNVSEASDSLVVTIDATAPDAPAAPSLATDSDTGASTTDGNTRDATPTVSGTAVAGSIITLYDTDGTTVLGTVTADEEGTWTITSSELTDGPHTLTVKATDPAGNVSAVSGNLNVTIDTAAPTLNTAGSSPADNATGTSIGASLILKFSERIDASSDLTKVYLKDVTTDTLVPATVTLNSNGEVVIKPTSSLSYSSAYYVTWAAEALKDLAGNVMTAVVDETTYNFTTTAAPADPPPPAPNDDGDDIPPEVEDQVPSLPSPDGTVVAGDGNGDGVVDSEQPSVTSAPFRNTDTVSDDPNAPVVFVTLVAGSNEGTPDDDGTITEIRQLDAPPVGDEPGERPADLNLPLGLMSFTATTNNPGAPKSFSLFVPSNLEINGYWKPTASGWVNLASPEYGGQIVTVGDKTRLDFVIEDGGPFDTNPAPGVIGDPGGPGFMQVDTPPPGNDCPYDPFKPDADGDGMPDTIEATLGSNPTVKDNDVFNDDLLFVRQLYRDLLGREGEVQGMNHWLQDLAQGQTHAELVATFIHSPELDVNAGAIVRLYHATLGRSPDYCGFNYWLSESLKGLSAEQMGNAFLQSPEFVGSNPDLTNEAFVDLLYLNVLGREADPDGKAYWLDQMAQGMSRGSVLYEFAQSEEYKTSLEDEVAIDMLYLGLLDREDDQPGWDFWHGQYAQYDSTADFYTAAMEQPEYHDRFMPSQAEVEPVSLTGVTAEPGITGL